jgi:hypothetical protein
MAKVGEGNGRPGLGPPKDGCNDTKLRLFMVEVLRTHPEVLAADENQRAFLADLAVMLVRAVESFEMKKSGNQQRDEVKEARKQAARRKPAKRRRRVQPSSDDEEDGCDEEDTDE